MTFGEIFRAIDSNKRVKQERACYDYILADLIGKSVARLYSASNTFPTLADTYPSLFEKEALEGEIKRNKDNISAIRFRQFAELHNKRFKGE